jgi:hypothetical protein
MLLIVTLVLVTEKMLQHVLVQKDIMRTIKLIVHLVLLNVVLVKVLLITVSLVVKEESIHLPDVFVKMVNTSKLTINIVNLVIILV